VSWLHCQKISGLEYWVQLLIVIQLYAGECTLSVDRAKET